MNIDLYFLYNQKDKLIELTKVFHPNIKIDETKKIDICRLSRKLIRQNDIILTILNNVILFNCPIFVYIDLLKSFSFLEFYNLKLSDDLIFEFDDKLSYQKKINISSIYEDITKNTTTLSEENKITYLPLCTYISFSVCLTYSNYLEIFSSYESRNIKNKTKNMIHDLYVKMIEIFPEFFSSTNIQIYKNTIKKETV